MGLMPELANQNASRRFQDLVAVTGCACVDGTCRRLNEEYEVMARGKSLAGEHRSPPRSEHPLPTDLERSRLGTVRAKSCLGRRAKGYSFMGTLESHPYSITRSTNFGATLFTTPYSLYPMVSKDVPKKGTRIPKEKPYSFPMLERRAPKKGTGELSFVPIIGTDCSIFRVGFIFFDCCLFACLSVLFGLQSLGLVSTDCIAFGRFVIPAAGVR